MVISKYIQYGCADYEFKRDGRSAWLYHYPIYEWHKMHHGAYHLHGHVHGSEMPIGGRILDVAPESTGKLLIDWEEVCNTLDNKPIRTHH